MIRTRIGPSPTGFAHVGTAYTGLFNYAFARNNGGEFIVRIEDTDRVRHVPEAEKAILKSLKWIGLSWDESVDVGGKHAPYRQSDRLGIYKKYANELLEKDFAYEDDGAQVRAYLTAAGLLPTDLEGAIFHEYLKVQEGRLVPALSQSDAHLTKINLTRSAYDDIPSLGPNPNQANVWFLVSGSTQPEKKILSGEFHYVAIDPERVSTYPIKTAQSAWEELNSGGGYIAQAPEGGQVVVRRVYLANYDPNKFEEYIQPIVVFEGDGFLAYVPAVTAEYYGK